MIGALVGVCFARRKMLVRLKKMLLRFLEIVDGLGICVRMQCRSAAFFALCFATIFDRDEAKK